MARIKGHTDYPTNGPLMHDVFKLYQRLRPAGKKDTPDRRRYTEGDLVVDWTYGLGSFWKVYRPSNLKTSDLFEEGADSAWDYTRPLDDAVSLWLGERPKISVFDPPYMLTGSTTAKRFGLPGKDMTVNDRIDMMRKGAYFISQATDTLLMIKCQDQSASNSPYRLHDLIAEVLPKEWVFDSTWSIPSNREQPDLGKVQRRPDNNRSELRVYWKRGTPWKRDYWKPQDVSVDINV